MDDMIGTGGIILNDDFAHFISSRHRYGIEVNKKVIEDYIDQYKGTQITEFCININASLSYTPSKIIETAFDKFLQKEADGVPVDFSETDLALAYDIYVNKGLDMHKIMFDRLRHIEIEPWLSVRMNDLHGFRDITDRRTTNFRSHADKNDLCRTTHRPHHDYFDKCFDYMQPEIRNRILSYIEEQLNNYDVDGIELDFMREALCFKIGEEARGREVINNILRHIKVTAGILSKSRGRDIKIMARVPSNPVDAYDMGFDIYTWANENLVDILVPTPRFTTCDSTLPLETWVRTFENHSMQIAGGIELFTHPYPGKVDYSFCNTPEMALGYAVQYLSAGTGKIYLYNYFDDPGLEGNPEVDTMSFTNDDIECDNVRGPSAQAKCYNLDFLSAAGSLVTCMDLPRRHIHTFKDFAPRWINNASKLPLEVHEPDYKKITVKTEYLSIDTGEISLGRQVYLLIGSTDIENIKNLTVWCNSELCSYERTTKIYPHMTSGRVYVYRIPFDVIKKYRQTFEFASHDGTVQIDYAEVRIF